MRPAKASAWSNTATRPPWPGSSLNKATVGARGQGGGHRRLGVAAGLIEVRRRIQRIAPVGERPAFDPDIFRSRYLQLRRFDRLDVARIEALGKVLAGRPELETAWRLPQHLYGIHVAQTAEDANQALGAFITAYHQQPLPEYESIIDTLLNWGDEIFAFHHTNRATNGRIEGTNNKLGVLKRIAYGFVNPANFGHRALLLTPAMAPSP